MTWFRIGYTEHYHVAVEADSEEEAKERFEVEELWDEFDRDVGFINNEIEVWQELRGPGKDGITFPKPLSGPAIDTARSLLEIDELGTADPEYVRALVEMVYYSVNPGDRPWAKLDAARSIHPEVAILMQDMYGWSK